MKQKVSKKYDEFVFFSAGPVGDHLVLIDFANRFFESTGIRSRIIMKHPNRFLNDFTIPYKEHIHLQNFVGNKGVVNMLLLMIKSIFKRYCYIFIFPIPAPRYIQVFSWYIRFCTRSRVVAFTLEGTRSFPVGKGYASFIGRSNTIPLLPEMFYVSAERMLEFLGFTKTGKVPTLAYVESASVYEKIPVKKGEYMVMHLNASHCLRSLPEDRWNGIIKAVQEKRPNLSIVFTGSKADEAFIQMCTEGINKQHCYFDFSRTTTQETLTLYAHAKVIVTVNTGIGLVVNMLHVPTVMVAVKGTTMFDYRFNEKATVLYSEKDCTCHPLEMECTMVLYKGKEYMACLFNLNDEDIVSAILAKV